MESGFDFVLYNTVFYDCFIHSSRYKNGNLQLSLYGKNYDTNETEHFADITLNQEKRLLGDGEIIVDCKYKPTLIPQLLKLGILKEQIGIFAMKGSLYPIYTINLTVIKQKEYFAQELLVA